MTAHIDDLVARGEIGGRTVRILDTGEVDCHTYPVAPLADGEWVAVNTVIEEQTAWSLIPKLKQANAQGIVEYPLNKVVM